MAEMTRRNIQVSWGPVIGGALVAIAVTIVLGLFGAAFGFGGLTALSAVWQIFTPLVATFIGALAAVALARESSYANAVMVWCLALIFSTAVLLIAPFRVAGSAAVPALAALAAVLGLIGALVGAGLGAGAVRRYGIGVGSPARSASQGNSGYGEPYQPQVKPSSEVALRREEQEDRTHH
jgi:LytS/YehU family sensor histidine kinase